MVASEDAVYISPVVHMKDNVPSVKLVEALERYSIRELSWWIDAMDAIHRLRMLLRLFTAVRYTKSCSKSPCY